MYFVCILKSACVFENTYKLHTCWASIQHQDIPSCHIDAFFTTQMFYIFGMPWFLLSVYPQEGWDGGGSEVVDLLTSPTNLNSMFEVCVRTVVTLHMI